jgi:ssDNA-binding Zn-finger/Zn-ribbon topoisomerase 1
MKDELEVYCPKCGRLFKGRDRMLEHLDKEHVSDKVHVKELILEIDARYLGGHPAFNHKIYGSLSLYSYPQNKVVFKSAKFAFEIPISKIRSAIAPTEKDRSFVIEFEDELGANQTVVFNRSDYMTDFANELLNLRVSMKTSEKAITQEITKEAIIKVRCPYCKFTYDKKLDKCPHCGAMNP